MNTTPKPNPFELSDAASLPDLIRQLNRQADRGHLVLTFAPGSEDPATGKGVNRVIYAINDADDIRDLGLLSVEPVPAGARAAEEEKAATPDEKQAVEDAYLAFISPLLENHVALCRADVFVNGEKLEVVLLREAEQYQPSSLSGLLLTGGPGWEWLTAEVVGNDIVVHGAHATTFGGSADISDDGNTASGYSTRWHPDVKGCSLALGGYAHSAKDVAALGGTPLPHLPFGLDSNGNDRAAGAHVEVWDPQNPGTRFTYPVIDLGPAKRTKHALDLTVAAARDFLPRATANDFSMVLDYRIINGALGLPAAQRNPPASTPGNPVPGGVSGMIFASAVQNVGMNTANAPDTNGGTLACAWAVNEVVRLSQRGRPIGGETSTADMNAKLKAGAGTPVSEAQATPGSIIISPTEGSQHGHVGILGRDGDIYSNSSRDKQFEKNWIVSNWKKYYSGKGLKVLFYNVVA